jgi:hypothetical protein
LTTRTLVADPTNAGCLRPESASNLGPLRTTCAVRLNFSFRNQFYKFEGARLDAPFLFPLRGSTFMKRFGILLSGVLLASVIGGCDSGIPEGAPKDGPTDPQPASFKEYMKKNADKMAPKGKMTKPKAQAETTTAPAAAPEAKDNP